MPHPVRDTQTTTTPPHQPSPPTPPPRGTPFDPRFPPRSRLPTLLAAPAWARPARRPASRAADVRWVARRSAPARPPLTLALCRPQRLVCGQQGRGLARCSRLPVCPTPLPLAVLRAANWGRVGCRRVEPAEQASGTPWSRSSGPRSTCAWPLLVPLGHPSQQRFSAPLPAVPLPFGTVSVLSVGLTDALDRPGVVELGRGCADGVAKHWCAATAHAAGSSQRVPRSMAWQGTWHGPR